MRLLKSQLLDAPESGSREYNIVTSSVISQSNPNNLIKFNFHILVPSILLSFFSSFILEVYIRFY